MIRERIIILAILITLVLIMGGIFVLKAPRITQTPEKSIQIEPLGGLNAAVLPSQIEDNQASELNNMWVRNGALRLRPGLVQQIENEYGPIVDVCPKDGTVLEMLTIESSSNPTTHQNGIYILTKTAVLQYTEIGFTRIPTDFDYSGPGGTIHWIYNDIDFTNSRMIEANKIVDDVTSPLDKSSGYAVYISGGGNFFEVAPVLLYQPGTASTYLGNCIVKTPGEETARTFPVYIPTIEINKSPSGGGDALEYRNYINPAVREEYTTNSTDTVYHLTDESISNTTVQIEYDNLSGTTYTVIFSASQTSKTMGGITVTLDRSDGTVTFSSALVNASASNAANNLSIQYSKSIYGTRNPIKNGNILAWFGGTYQSVESGNYLFVSGNYDEPNAIYWSKPTDDGSLYFPENNKNYLGNPSDKITAFGKQFDILAVLKEHSLQRITYQYDATNLEALFPAKEVSNGIGCDCPGSIQIINNNLTWCNSTGGVYTLLSTSVQDERIVRPLSRNINKQILVCSKSDLQTSSSVDAYGYYMLFVGNKAFLWDYDNTPFANYSDTEKAQTRLAWFMWTFEAPRYHAFILDGELKMFAPDDTWMYRLDEIREGIQTESFDAVWNSKMFDMDVPDRLKLPYYSSVGILSKDPLMLDISFIDDEDEDGSVEAIDGTDFERLTSIRVLPTTIWTQEYGISVKSVSEDTTPFGIKNIIIKAKIGRQI